MLDGYSKYRKNLGLQACDAGAWAEAFVIMSELSSVNPLDFDATWLSGVCLTKLDRADEALVYFRRAFFLAPDRKDILAQLASVAEYAGDVETASAAYCGALELSPQGDAFALREVLRLLVKRLCAVSSGEKAGLAFSLIYRMLNLVERETVGERDRTDVGRLIGRLMHGPALLNPSWKADIKQEMLQADEGRVSDGLYRGMRLSPGFAAACSHLDVLGLSDHQLFDILAGYAGGDCDGVLVVGAGLGYHAVGLARMLPGARVVAWEADAARRAVCGETAAANGVEDRLRLMGEVDADALAEAAAAFRRPLCLVNIGGDELLLLDEELIARLAHADVIVECHERLGIDVGGALSEQFAATHGTELLTRRSMDAWRIDCLRRLDSALRWFAVYELAPTPMVLAYDKRWLHAERRG